MAECAAKEPYSTQIGPFGDKIRAETYVSAGLPVLRGLNCSDSTTRFRDEDFVFVGSEKSEVFAPFMCEADDVILVHKGTLGKVGIIPKRSRYPRYVMGNSMMRVRCDRSKLLPLFLYYWLKSRHGQEYLYSRVSQVGVPQLQRPLTSLREAKFYCPPVQVQAEIVAMLGALDDKMELNAKMNRTLEAMARALFRSWFVDFDPVRAKMEGRPTGLPDEVAALFPESLVDSPMGEVPEGWGAGTVADTAVLNPDSIGQDYARPQIQYVEISGVGAGFIQEATLYSKGDEPSRAKRLVNHGDTVISTVRPERRNFFLAFEPSPNLVVSTGFVTLRPKNVPWVWLYLAATQSDNFVELGRLADGGAYPAVRPEVVGRLPIVLPLSQVMEEFGNIVEPMLSRYYANVEQNRTLAALRDTLLPKLLSGELRVPLEAEPHV